jgi:hypothetical protein
MRFRSVVAAIALSTLALAGASSQAHAATWVQTLNFGPMGANATSPLSFLAFDTSLGTLTAINITLESTLTARVRVNNLEGTPLTWTSATGSISTTVTGPAGTSTSNALSISDNTGGTLPPNSEYIGDFFNANDSDMVSVNPANFAAYTGGGTFNINVSSSPYAVTGSGDDGLLYGGNASVLGSVRLEYVYTSVAIPEPGTLALLAPALLMGGVVVARRTHKGSKKVN